MIILLAWHIFIGSDQKKKINMVQLSKCFIMSSKHVFVQHIQLAACLKRDLKSLFIGDNVFEFCEEIELKVTEPQFV